MDDAATSKLCGVSLHGIPSVASSLGNKRTLFGAGWKIRGVSEWPVRRLDLDFLDSFVYFSCQQEK